MIARKSNSAEKDSTTFWENMVDHYPRPFEAKIFKETERVIAMARARGIAFKNASVLDIGCGTGIYALPLAREAASVTGIDSSKAMIACMKTEMDMHHLTNVQTAILSWKNMDIGRLGFEKAFDIVWASMTPAIQNEDDFAKMEQCSQKWCVYIGWGRKRKNPLMEAAFKSHNLSFGPHAGVGHALDLISKTGKKPSLDYFDTWWDWSGTVEEAVDDVAGYISMQQAAVDREKLREIISPYEKQGKIYHRTEVEEGILIWQVR